MRQRFRPTAAAVLLCVANCATAALADEAPAAAPGAAGAEQGAATPSAPDSVWDSVHPSTLWYLQYQSGQHDGEPNSRVHVGRGYVNLEVEPVEWFRPRVTLDTHQDDAGDWKVRLKYLHAKFVLPIETAVITESTSTPTIGPRALRSSPPIGSSLGMHSTSCHATSCSPVSTCCSRPIPALRPTVRPS